MTYLKPKQPRALATEREFLRALDELLNVQSFEETSVQEIAARAHLTKSAFLKRFGSKEQALFRLFQDYTDDASALMQRFSCKIEDHDDLHELLVSMCDTFEDLLLANFGSNRGMNEYFKRDLESHDLTKKIFFECVGMMKKVQQKFFPLSGSDVGANAAAQLLVSLNFHYVMRAMPALPQDKQLRYELNAELIELALKK